MIFFLRLYFVNGDEQGGPSSRHLRPASLPPPTRDATSKIWGGGAIVQRWTFFDSIFFPSPLLSLVFFLPFPIVFRNRNFFSLFLSLLMSAYLGLNMSETRLNLLFLMVLLSRLETDWRWIDTACYFVCIIFIFFEKTYVFFLSRHVIFFPLFSFWWCFYSVPSLSYLEICLMVPSPPQFPPPPLFFEICSFVSGGTKRMEEEEEEAFNP